MRQRATSDRQKKRSRDQRPAELLATGGSWREHTCDVRVYGRVPVAAVALSIIHIFSSQVVLQLEQKRLILDARHKRDKRQERRGP